MFALAKSNHASQTVVYTLVKTYAVFLVSSSHHIPSPIVYSQYCESGGTATVKAKAASNGSLADPREAKHFFSFPHKGGSYV